MNNLFSSASWKRDVESGGGGTGDVEMGTGAAAGGANLDRFFEDVEAIKDELREVERLHRSLHEANEAGKTLHEASAVRELRGRMDADVALALKKAKLIKLRLESLDRANAANRAVPGCGPGSSTDRTRSSVVAGLRKKLRDSMEAFAELRRRIAAEYRETVGRRYYTVTGESPDEATVDALVATGEGERFLQRAIEEQGRGRVLDVVAEIQERHGAVAELERSLLELQQVFMDMAVLVEAQGQQLDDIESNVGRAQSFVRHGTDNLTTARVYQKNTRKWTCIAIILLLIIILVIVLPTVLSLTKKRQFALPCFFLDQKWVVKGEKDALKFLKQFHMKLAEFLAVIDRTRPRRERPSKEAIPHSPHLSPRKASRNPKQIGGGLAPTPQPLTVSSPAAAFASAEPPKIDFNVDLTQKLCGALLFPHIRQSSNPFSQVIARLSIKHPNLFGRNEKLDVLWDKGIDDFNILIAFRRPRPDWLSQQSFTFQHSVAPEIAVHGLPVDHFTRSGSGGVNLSRSSVGVDFNEPSTSHWSSKTSIKFEHVRPLNNDGHTINRDMDGFPITSSGRSYDNMIVLKQESQYAIANDDRFTKFNFQMEQGLPLLSKWLIFNRFKIVASKGFKLGPTFLVTSLTGGSIVGDMAPYQAFALGGIGSVRGYGEGAVGSGRTCLVANGEFTIPVTKELEGAIFMDCGTDLGSARYVPGNPALRQGKPGFGVGLGYGVRFNSHLGQIRVDYAINAFQRKTLYFGINGVGS
ncbi:unnamed protein product [Musa acuminata var. zebrina]